MDSVELNGVTHVVKLPLHPIRYRLHSAFGQAEEGYDGLAVCCAVLGACCPTILGTPELEQRALLRTNVIDFGEQVLDRLVEGGCTPDTIASVSQSLVRIVFGMTPTDEEVESHVDFTEDRVEAST